MLSDERTDAEQAAWLADKIAALGDYAKEAAAMLRRWPESALSQSTEQGERDAARYRWLRDQRGLLLESAVGFWTRPDGTRFYPTHRLCAGSTQYAAYETLDETIDAAMSPHGDGGNYTRAEGGEDGTTGVRVDGEDQK